MSTASAPNHIVPPRIQSNGDTNSTTKLKAEMETLLRVDTISSEYVDSVPPMRFVVNSADNNGRDMAPEIAPTLQSESGHAHTANQHEQYETPAVPPCVDGDAKLDVEHESKYELTINVQCQSNRVDISSTSVEQKEKLEALDKNGFVVLCNLFDDEHTKPLQQTCCQIVESRNFQQMFQVADEKLIPLLRTHLNWSSPRYGLTFMSNNDNPQAWHRDIYSNDNQMYPEEYTMLLYLDETVLYVFQGTHKHPTVNVLSYFDNSSFVPIQLKQGDVVVFWSHLIHQGHFDTVFKPRRMILLHQVFPNAEMEKEVEEQRQIWQMEESGQQRENRVKLLKAMHSCCILHCLMQFFTFLLLAFNLHKCQPTVCCTKQKKTDNEDGKFISYGRLKYARREEFI